MKTLTTNEDAGLLPDADAATVASRDIETVESGAKKNVAADPSALSDTQRRGRVGLRDLPVCPMNDYGLFF